MSNHRFAVGQNVRLRTARFPRTPTGSYEVVRLMPSDDGTFAYRIKNDDEQFVRVAQEYELSDYGSPLDR
jgi:hypothetical protein